MKFKIFKVRKITEKNELEGKIIKDEIDLPNFPSIGSQIKIGNKNYNVHSVTLPNNPNKLKTINVN